MSDGSSGARRLSDALVANAQRHPGSIAAVEADRRITWTELHDAVSELAGALADLGVQVGDLVGVQQRNGISQLIALHAAMRLGAAFVPIDPDSPSARIRAIAEQCDLDVLFADAASAPALAEADLDATIILDGDAPGNPEWLARSGLTGSRAVTEPVDFAADELAYVMFTSGSTGPPKGMQHSHWSSLGFASWGAAYADLGPGDVVANFSPLHFDISVFDLFSSLLAGSTSVFVPRRMQPFPAQVARLLESERVTVAFTVPFALARLARLGGLEERNLDSLRWVLFGGEPFQPSDLARLMELLPGARFANVFGPAEAPACVVHEVERPLPLDRPVPIGHLAPQTHGLVATVGTDDPVEVGEVGELLISAPSITLGYHRRPDLNATSRSTIDGREYFRTGDLVRRDPDGLLHFVGRGDRMVKTRGYRVELDEVEAALAGHDGVLEAAVYAVEDGETRLVAASILEDPDRGGADDRSLRAHLSRVLPSYAFPTEVRRPERFPRTTSGKIDRRALAAAHETERAR